MLNNTTETGVATDADRIDHRAEVRLGQWEATVYRHSTGTHSLSFTAFGDRYANLSFQLTAADFDALAKLLTDAVVRP